MAHNTTDESQEDRESRLWIASRKYVTGQISTDKLREIENDYTKDFKNAMLTISERELWYSLLLDRILLGGIRKLWKPRSVHDENLPSGHRLV